MCMYTSSDTVKWELTVYIDRQNVSCKLAYNIMKAFKRCKDQTSLVYMVTISLVLILGAGHSEAKKKKKRYLQYLFAFWPISTNPFTTSPNVHITLHGCLGNGWKAHTLAFSQVSEIGWEILLLYTCAFSHCHFWIVVHAQNTKELHYNFLVTKWHENPGRITKL